ncbi:MAG: SDR family NAD(P)-dependent oxidoreductase [Solirubrobacterales bacterium]
MDLNGQTVLLTGSGGGLGPAIAQALAARGARLVLAERPDQRSAIPAIAGAEAVTADLADPEGSAALVRAATEAAGPIDVLVNNAGIELIGVYTRHTPEELERITRVNLLAPMEVIALVLPGMLERRRGHVVNMGSLAGRVATAYASTYTATKHALVGLTHSLRAEYEGGPVGFSVVCPGFVSDVGMYGRHEDAAPAPAMLGTVPATDVGAAVVKAIESDSAEVIVSARPVRPIIALASVAPKAAARLGNRLGVGELWRRVGERHGRT